MKPLIALIAAVIVASVLFFASAFVVQETEQVVVLQFGEVMRLVDKPGLSFLVPFVQDAKRFDKRWLEWDGEANQITTRDKRYIYIEVFARWRIKNTRVFIENVRDETSALGRLDDILDNATRNVVANHRLIEVIRASNRDFEYDVDEVKSAGQPNKKDADAKKADAASAATGSIADTLEKDSDTSLPNAAAEAAVKEPKKAADKDPGYDPNHDENNEQRLSDDADNYSIETGRDKLTRMVLEKAQKKAASLGIEIKDVQIKRINYIESVELKVFDRMISERKRVAEAYRSEGQGRSAEISGKMEMELKQIQSEAYMESQKIMGRADAKAAEIYAGAYGKDPDFYQFVKTMESYKQTIDSSYSLYLSTDGDYAGHLKSISGKTAGK
jgi:membrane protease subunit HflC